MAPIGEPPSRRSQLKRLRSMKSTNVFRRRTAAAGSGDPCNGIHHQYKCPPKARRKGSEYNDIIIDTEGKTGSNHAGGINGGITNGNELVFRAAVRPPSSIQKEQKTINLKTNSPTTISVQGRHDACIALRIPVIIEAATATVLADLMLIEQKIPRIMR